MQLPIITGLAQATLESTTSAFALNFKAVNAAGVSLNNATAIIEKVNPKNGITKTICHETSLIALLAYNATVDPDQHVSQKEVANVLTEVEGLILLARNGALTLETDETLIITLKGLQTTATYTINAIEHPNLYGQPVEYLPYSTKGQTSNEYDLNDVDAVLIEKSLAPTIELQYPARRMKISQAETDIIIGQMHGVVITKNVDGLATFDKYTDDTFNVVHVNECSRMYLNSNNTTGLVVLVK